MTTLVIILSVTTLTSLTFVVYLSWVVNKLNALLENYHSVYKDSYEEVLDLYHEQISRHASYLGLDDDD